MELNEYQEKAMKTCMPSSANLSYMLLGLNEETGELSGKVAKLIRKGRTHFSSDGNVSVCGYDGEIDKTRTEIVKELGDVMWMAAGCAMVLGVPLENVCQMNLDKLAAREANNTIDGQGDGVTKEERRGML